MKWRCGAWGGEQRCMLAPGHQGAHQSVLMADGQVGLVTWLSPEITWLPQESGAGVPHDAGAAQSPSEPAPEPVVYTEATIELPPRRSYGRHSDLAGRARTRRTLNNPYAALDEGIHTNWDLFGHEIVRLPTLDEIEMEMR